MESYASHVSSSSRIRWDRSVAIRDEEEMWLAWESASMDLILDPIRYKLLEIDSFEFGLGYLRTSIH